MDPTPLTDPRKSRRTSPRPSRRSSLCATLTSALTLFAISACFSPGTLPAQAALPCPIETLLTPDEGWPDDDFGQSIAVSGDVAIIGSPRAGYGRVHFFRKLGGTWVREQRIEAPSITAAERFGWSVDIEGPVAVIGAPVSEECGGALPSGRVVVLRFDPALDSWEFEQSLCPSSATAVAFGERVRLDGDRIAVGDSLDDSGSGRVELFEYDAVSGQWLPEQLISTTVPLSSEFFGTSFALSGDHLAVGIPGRNDGTASVGAVEMFERDPVGGTWSEVATVTPPPGSIDNFGRSVDLSPTQLVIGAPEFNGDGEVYVLERNLADVWTVVQTILGPLSAVNFGSDLRLQESRLVVGDVTAAASDGAVYLYEFDAVSGEYDFETELTSGSTTTSEFGEAFAVIGDEAIVGDPADRYAGPFRGLVQVLVPGATGDWEVAQTILPLDGAGDDEFGATLALAGDRLIVGSPGAGDLSERAVGTVSSYVRQGGAWIEEQVIFPPTPPGDRFGLAVAVTADRLAVLSRDIPSELHIYARNATDTAWVEEQLLVGASPPHNFNNGTLWLAGDHLVIGSPASAVSVGAALHYSRDPGTGTWSFVSEIFGQAAPTFDRLGSSLDVEGSNLFVGVRQFGQGTGRVERYEWQDGIGTLAQTIPGVATQDSFGSSLAADGDLLAVGAAGDNSAHVYRRDASGDYLYEQELTTGSSLAGSRFGASIVIEGDIVVVGAPDQENAGINQTGAAHVFRLSGPGGTWNHLGALLPPAPAEGQHFGASLALSNGLLVIGEPENGLACGPVPGCDAGAIHTVDLDGCGVVTFLGFVRGDASGDGLIQINDAIVILTALFGGGSLGCPDAADTNDDGAVDLADPISVLGFLFGGALDPPSPFPDCGDDGTADALDCPFFGGCAP